MHCDNHAFMEVSKNYAEYGNIGTKASKGNIESRRRQEQLSSFRALSELRTDPHDFS
jgi:hypothetical protein